MRVKPGDGRDEDKNSLTSSLVDRRQRWRTCSHENFAYGSLSRRSTAPPPLPWSPEDRDPMSVTRAAKAQAISGRAPSASTRSSWEALGTSAVLQVTDPRALARARAIVERELELLDRACSRFRPDSDLQRVNAAQGRLTPVSPLLIDAVQVALDAAELTGGDVDPTVGNALVLAGYDRDWAQLERPLAGLGSAGVRESEGGPSRGDQPHRGDLSAGPADRTSRPRRPAIRARVTPG